MEALLLVGPCHLASQGWREKAPGGHQRGPQPCRHPEVVESHCLSQASAGAFRAVGGAWVTSSSLTLSPGQQRLT